MEFGYSKAPQIFMKAVIYGLLCSMLNCPFRCKGEEDVEVIAAPVPESSEVFNAKVFPMLQTKHIKPAMTVEVPYIKRRFIGYGPVKDENGLNNENDQEIHQTMEKPSQGDDSWVVPGNEEETKPAMQTTLVKIPFFQRLFIGYSPVKTDEEVLYTDQTVSNDNPVPSRNRLPSLRIYGAETWCQTQACIDYMVHIENKYPDTTGNFGRR